MAQLISLKTYTDSRGNLTVIEKVLPFEIKRIFYIYGTDQKERGGHRHKSTVQAAICLRGECKVRNHDGSKESTYHLDSPEKCLILEPEDYHSMFDFSADALLMVVASTYFEEEDYVFEPY